MWIRSQNKRVLKQCTSLTITSIEFSEDCMILADAITKLGTYSSEEKAMKVMDMIERKLLEYDYQEGFQTSDCSYYPTFAYEPPKVFQMPKDEEVL